MTTSAENAEAATGGDLDVWILDGALSLPALEASWQAIGSIDALPAQSTDAGRRAAHLALRLLIADRLGNEVARQPFAYDVHGKPFLLGNSLHFSLGHSDVFSAVALSHAGPVGIDIEYVRDRRISGARRKWMEGAAEALAGKPIPTGEGERRFIEAWTRLEATAKATGEGVGALLERIGIRGFEDLRNDSYSPPPRLRIFDLTTVPEPPFAAAVAATFECNHPKVQWSLEARWTHGPFHRTS